MANSALGSQSIALLQLPAGMLIDFAGTVEPQGWLMCDGRAVSRTTYSALFASIGIAYGSGDGSTTFNLPDFRGRFARYNDNMGTVAGAALRDFWVSPQVLSSSSITAGNYYRINWVINYGFSVLTALGAPNNNIGTVFKATRSASSLQPHEYEFYNGEYTEDMRELSNVRNVYPRFRGSIQDQTLSSSGSTASAANLDCNKLIKI